MQNYGYGVGGASRSSDELPVMGMERRVGSLNGRKGETMTGHSNTGLTGTTKLDRIGKLAQTHPNTVYNAPYKIEQLRKERFIAH